MALSTYSKLQYAKNILEYVKLNFDKFKLNVIKKPTDEEHDQAFRFFEYVKNNIYYVGHNVGTLGNHIDDQYKIIGDTHIKSLVRCYIYHKKDANKILQKRYNDQKKQKEEALEKEIEERDRQREEYNNNPKLKKTRSIY